MTTDDIQVSVELDVVAAIDHVVDYLYDDEKRHFEAADPEDRENHIFVHLRLLGDFLQALDSHLQTRAKLERR